MKIFYSIILASCEDISQQSYEILRSVINEQIIIE